jgi:hypothetical protein
MRISDGVDNKPVEEYQALSGVALIGPLALVRLISRIDRLTTSRTGLSQSTTATRRFASTRSNR